MAERDSARLRADHLLSVRIDAALFKTIQQDANQLGISLADVSRFRLRTGSVPIMPPEERKSNAFGPGGNIGRLAP
jgi:hypothetical protein